MIWAGYGQILDESSLILLSFRVGEGPMPNRLATSTSPYLRQHQNNPVDWYPWGAEALERAQRDQKPILLSIGYSSCHWCHVMEREAFSDASVAAVLNEHFISIKVDREERPDLDHIYMQAVQMMTGSGGWPLNVFLTPDLRPFYGGTYFPLEAKFGRMPFRDLLLRIVDIFYAQADEVKRNSDQLTSVLIQESRQFKSSDQIGIELIQKGLLNLERNLDREYGGLGGAPKFFHTSGLRLLLKKGREEKKQDYLDGVSLSLTKMAEGGVFDQIGGGFHRYSTDAEWKIPHFEKMLYDNALLVPLYVEAWALTKNEFFREIVEKTLDWALREMKNEAGEFYSAIDADSEHEEGKFYRWSQEEITSLLNAPEQERLSAVFEEIEFEGGLVFKLKPGTNSESRQAVRPILEKMRVYRDQRIWPLIDKKVLTSWNGLMISALACAGHQLSRRDYLQAAQQAAGSILRSMHGQDRLLHSKFENVVNSASFLEDYSYLIQGLLDLFEATAESKWAEEAQRLNEEMLSAFYDSSAGGFWSTRRDQSDLLVASKQIFDGALPSAYSIALSNILRIYSQKPETNLYDVFHKSVKLILGTALESPGGFSSLALCLSDYHAMNQMQCEGGVCERPANSLFQMPA